MRGPESTEDVIAFPNTRKGIVKNVIVQAPLRHISFRIEEKVNPS